MKQFPNIINSLFVYLQNNEVRGKYRLYQLTHKLFKRFVIRHCVAGNNFYVPYDQWCFWKNYGPNNYYLDEMLPFTEAINTHCDAFDFIDLGADIGTVSALVNKHCGALNRVIAVEPNPVSFEILQHNFTDNSELLNCAVSDFNGSCQFNFHAEQGSDHEGHIDPSKQGETKVITLDSLLSNDTQLLKQIVIKIDVEGQELAVFKGAKALVQQSDKVIVLLELHPDTLTRDGLTPEQIFSEAEQLGNFTWLVPLSENAQVNRNKDFFEQFPYQQYDVIGILSQ